MNWKRMLAYVTGSVDEELLARNEYLVTENRILRGQIKGRMRLSDPERISLASAAKRLGRKALEEVAQMARNMSLAEVGFLNGCRYLLHDRDARFCEAFTEILEAVGIKSVKLPPRSPNLNAPLERWHRSVKEECLSQLILFGEASLRQALSNYVAHFHGERNHQGKGNVILFPRSEDRIGESTGEIQTRERLGGLLKFYYRDAA